MKLHDTSEVLLQNRSPEITNFESGEAASILPQQFSIDRQVLIAPPIDLAMQSQSPNPDQIEESEYTVHNKGNSKCNDLPEIALEISIPELVRKF